MADNQDKELYINFDEYIRQGEPSRREAAYAWSTAIGLQAVDGLTTSEYLHQTALRHIEGEITIDEARQLLRTYYESKNAREAGDDDKEEADRVSANIVKVLSSPTLDFSAGGYMSVHRRVFEGVLKHAGELRNYDITKREWVLEGDTVRYMNWEDIRRALDYDLEQERAYSYSGKSSDELVAHLARFVANLWQVHAFREGNTRTTAVFTIQYLRSLGFTVENDPFARHSWYFRNALVRANYANVSKGIDFNTVYLERFFRNLLLDDGWVLRNRYLHIRPSEEWRVQPNLKASASTPQVPRKYPTSTPQAPHKSLNENTVRLVSGIGREVLTTGEILAALQLKDRKNLLDLFLAPAIKEGFVRMLYPDKPRHPRQQYLLTEKGLMLYDEMMNRQ